MTRDPKVVPGRRRRQVPVLLTPDEWNRLEAAAAADERDPWQHARFLVLKGLREAEDEGTGESGQGTGEPALEAS